jgi:hypothetical protein
MSPFVVGLLAAAPSEITARRMIRQTAYHGENGNSG